jgi:hypothetical protein
VITAGRGIHALRSLPRGYKLAWVLLAAWAPLLLARSPWLAMAVMGGCTALFYCSTARRAEATAPTAAAPISREADDVEP